jgi:hypothetical protein
MLPVILVILHNLAFGYRGGALKRRMVLYVANANV